jgi:hypothetical protein
MESYSSNTILNRPSNLGAFPINHKLAGIVPMATEEEQVSLTKDIQTSGQREPIVLWKGEVIDGRCRQKSLLFLRFPIMYKELDEHLSEEEVRVYVKSVNTRRNLTTTQKITIAAKEYMKLKKVSVKKTAEAWGISSSILDNGIWLLKKHPEVIEELFNGRNVLIRDFSGKEISSSRITSIYAFYKVESQKAKENTEHGWKDHSFIKTQAGKHWYIMMKKECIAEGAVFSPTLDKYAQELTNYKFQLPSKEEENQ